MRILSLSLDTTLFNESSATAHRIQAYGTLVDEYIVIAPSEREEQKDLAHNILVYGVSCARTKLLVLRDMYRTAQLLCTQKQFDVITVQDTAYLALLGYALSKKHNIGLEIQVHGFEKQNLLRTVIAHMVLQRAHSVRVVSNRLRKMLTSTFRVQDNRITQIPIYVEPFSCDKQTYEAKNVFTFLTVGRLVPVKRIALQIVAMKEVLRKNPDILLRIVGTGPELDALRALVAMHHLEKYVEFVGSVRDIKHEYCAADAFLLTSQAEGWGMAVIEAAYAGVPILMTDVGCAGEIIVHNQSGVVLPHTSVDTLTEAMIRMQEDAKMTNELVAGAQLALKKLPTKEQTYHRYVESWERAARK